jgi:hypothetical protein
VRIHSVVFQYYIVSTCTLTKERTLGQLELVLEYKILSSIMHIYVNYNISSVTI